MNKSSAISEIPELDGEEICPVCEQMQILHAKFGRAACDTCNLFFETVVRKFLMPYCPYLGNPDILKGYGCFCHFCRMSKSYSNGLKSADVVKFDGYLEENWKRIHTPPSLDAENKELLKLCDNFKECLIMFEQYYYQWLSLSEKYKMLDKKSKKMLKERSYIRGTMLQMVERSFVAHDVLWLHNCFFHPCVCVNPLIRNICVLVLNLVIICKRTMTMKEFLSMKLKLALKDDVLVKGEEMIPENIFKAIDDIEEEVKLAINEGVIILHNHKKSSLISDSGLFLYKKLRHEYALQFPGHSIRRLSKK